MRKRKVIIVIPIIICLVCISALIIWRHVLPKKTGDMQGIDKITLSENLYIEPSGAEHIVQNRDTGIQYYDNEMILYVQTDTTVTEIEQLALNYDAKLTGANEYINMYLIRFSEAKSYETLINIQNELLKNDIISDVALNLSYQYYANSTYPESAIWPKEEWDGGVSGANWGAEAIHAPEAWDYKDQMEPVNVGVFDMGFNTNHEDLKNIIFDSVTSETNIDNMNHGTHVSGIIGAEWDSEGIGISGIAPTSRLAVYDVASLAGESAFADSAVWTHLIIEEKCKVINVSLGFGSENIVYGASQGNIIAQGIVLEEAQSLEKTFNLILDYKDENGIKYDFVICAAAGNSNNKEFYKSDDSEYGYYPICINEEHNHKFYHYIDGENCHLIWLGSRIERNGASAQWASPYTAILDERIMNRIIVVGASKLNDDGSYSLSDFSNTGDRVDVLAPGENILSSVSNAGASETAPDPVYDYYEGTSMASPFTAGLAAILWSLDSTLTGEEVKQIIVDTADIAVQDSEVRMINAENAVHKIINSKGPATQIEIRFSSDSGKESAVICGLNEQNEEVWNHTTGSYDRTELEQISEIGIYDDRFYYSEGGKIVSLALSNGSVMWENNEFGGASICSTIDNNGTIYMSGYYGPSFFAVDKDGATLVKIDSFGEEYYWPYAIEKIDDNTVVVTFEHGPEGAVAENEGFLIYVNLSDYSYSTIGANTTSSSQETNPINIFVSMPSDFTFSSGAGGWATQFTLEDDGSFTGQYHDSDMGDTGTEYPNGTVYISKFTGKFTTPTQINDYTYSMQLENLQAEGTTGEEYYENGQRFIYSDPYGFDNADVFLIYTPGAPMAELPEGFKSWLLAFMNPNEEQTLPCYGIYNVGGEEGFVGFEDTRENAQSGFDSSEESTQIEANSNGEKILSTEQLEAIKTNLNVPADLNVDIEQSEPTYWDAGGCWVTYVTFSYGGKTVAAASVNSDTAELVKDILVYTP